MWYNELFIKMEKSENKEQAQKMSAYMQNKFPFLGIPKPELKVIMKPYLATTKKGKLDWTFVFLCWDKEYREAQYVGVEYLLLHKKELVAEDLGNIKKFITTKSWWEVTDSLDELVGIIALKSPEIKNQMLQWTLDDNLWIRRVAIDFQQKFKEKTDPDLLKQIILNNLESKEFFINKAIGWSLREYSKISPDWVRRFIEEYGERLAPLSVREGNKLL